MKSNTELARREKLFLLSASSNGIFIDLFSINGWLLQIFAVDILLSHHAVVESLVLAYPVVVALELCALAIVGYVHYRTLLLYAFALRSLLVLALLLTSSAPESSGIVPPLYYVAFFFHIAGFHVCWPLHVKNEITPERRGGVLGRARAYTNIVSMLGLILVFIAAKAGSGYGSAAGLGLAILASIFSLAGLAGRYTGTSSRERWSWNSILPTMSACTSRLLAETGFRRVATETLSLGLVTLPLPLLYLPQTGVLDRPAIIAAFVIGLLASIFAYPAFGKLIDRTREGAYGLALTLGAVSTLATAAALSLSGVFSAHIVSGAVLLAIAANFVSCRLAGLYSYTRALDVGNAAASAASVLVISWLFDLAVWLGVAAMQVLPHLQQNDDTGSVYLIVCMASALASSIFLLLARRPQLTRHA
jgi:hypothetical protein